MDKDKKIDKVSEVIHNLPTLWFHTWRDAFILIMFFEMGFILYKLFELPSFLFLHLVFIKIFVFGFIYLLFLSGIVYLLQKYFIPSMRKRREERKKEFFQELKKELKKK